LVPTLRHLWLEHLLDKDQELKWPLPLDGAGD